MKTFVIIGIFVAKASLWQITLYRAPGGKIPEFGSYQQAERYINDRGLGHQASPIEVSEESYPARGDL